MATQKRFKVIKQFIKWKGVVYRAGELLPESYTERVWFREIYANRVAPVMLDSDDITGHNDDETEADTTVEIEESTPEVPEPVLVVEEPVAEEVPAPQEPAEVVAEKAPAVTVTAPKVTTKPAAADATKK